MVTDEASPAPNGRPETSCGQTVAEQLPLKRVGWPSDMAGLILYLCSEAGSFITGNCIHIDGGISIH
nr:SDR family oxidoreductase [Seongchinamella unica]